MKALLALGLLAAGLFAFPSSQDGERPVGQGLSAAARPAQEEEAPEPVAAPAGLPARVAALEAALAAERKRSDETRARLEQTISYLRRRAERSRAALASFDQAERDGFTAGINFRSREVLLGGLRGYLRDAELGLPAPARGPKVQAAPPAPQAGDAAAPSNADAAADEAGGDADAAVEAPAGRE